MRLIVSAASVALLLAGCAPGQMARPEAARVVPPLTWRTPLAATVPLHAEWWQDFGDPALDRLVTDALANNPDIATAAARVREARAQESLARVQLFPTLDLGVGATYARSVSPFGTPTTSAGVQPVFQAAYEVDLFGRIDNQIAAARLTGDALGAARDAAALSITAATVSGYLTLLGLDGRLQVVRDTIASRAEALRIARSRARVGYTSQLELRQAEAEYQATALILPQVQLAIARQENALSALAGRNPGPIARVSTIDRVSMPGVPLGLPSDLLRRRPDIAQAERTLAASDATIAAARAQYLPSLRLNGTGGAVLSNALANPLTIWSIGASILAPIFEGGRLRANVDAATARRDQAAFGYQKIALQAFRETEDALAAIDRLSEQERVLTAQRLAIADALRHATNRYRAGYSPYLEQLDAQRALLQVDLSRVQLRTDTLNARVALFQALGGGWRE
ncbi:efflux transporter outer membrane subunit [Sphingomonas sp. SUN039]|uniref:efflux transporter outer membrane subunit n=1 Tax=Sphingomonas sp. SUN039 TaxID=2937787 RepID=UPI002164513B|nr:efflux transporter outer membrane subunit [Sphingomonas sp. SUN039]UVO55906.1 efflux transporter outer membrane subunit [Sphingomonas sp. SUN039]